MIKKFILDIIASFRNDKDGASGRKLSAFAAVMTGIIITFRTLPSTEMYAALCVWLLFALVCLGLVTAGNLIELKNGKQPEKKSDEA